MVSAVILVRSLNADDFAAFSYFQITASMIATYSALGLGVTASRFFAEIGHENEFKHFPPIGMLCALSILFAIIAFFIVILFPKELLTAGLSISPVLMGLCVFMLALSVVPSGAVLGMECYRQAALVSALSGCVSLLSAYVASQLKDPFIAMVGITAAAGMQFLGESLIVMKVIGGEGLKKIIKLRWADINYVLSFAGPMLLVSLMAASGSWMLGRVILGGKNGEYEFSLYVVGLQWFSLGLFLPGMISRVLLPRLIRGKNVEARVVVRQAGFLALGAAVCIAIVGVILGPFMSIIYGDLLILDRWFIAAYLMAAVISAPANTIGNAIVASGGQKIWLGFTLVWLITLTITAYFFSGLGAWAGAVAQALASCLLVFLAFFYSRKMNLI